MSETHEEWLRRCVKQNVRCYVCGNRPNPWCTGHHLPFAQNIVAADRIKVEEGLRAVMDYELAIAQEPK